MKRCLLGHRAFVLQAPLHLPQGRAEERLVHLPLPRGMALPPTRSREILVSRCPWGLRSWKSLDTMERHRSGATGIWQSCPQEDPVSGLTVCHPAEPVSQLLSSCLTNKPRGPAGQLKGLSKPPADSRSGQRDWEGESRHPPCFLLPALDPEVPQDQPPVQV